MKPEETREFVPTGEPEVRTATSDFSKAERRILEHPPQPQAPPPQKTPPPMDKP